MPGLPGLPPPGFSQAASMPPPQMPQQPQGLPGLPPPGFSVAAQPEQPTFAGDLPAIGGRFIQGAADLASTAENVVQFPQRASRYLLNQIYPQVYPPNDPTLGDQIQEGMKASDFPTEPKTGLGKVAGEIAYYAPNAAIPGGATKSGLFSLLSGGLGAGVTKAAGGGEAAQGVAGLATSVAAPLSARGASKVATGVADEFLKGALNVQRSDLAKAEKYVPNSGKITNKESTLMRALRGVQERGLFKGGTQIPEIAERNRGAISSLGDEATDLLQQVDAAQKAQNSFGFPTFDRVRQFLKAHPHEEDQLRDQFHNRLGVIMRNWDNSISGANKEKQALYNIGYEGAAANDSRALDRAIASDFREFIEQQSGKLLGPEVAEKIKGVNARQGQHLAIEDLLLKNKYQEEMPGGAAKALRRMFVSPMGGSALGVGATAVTGNPMFALAGLLGAAGTSRAGQFGISKTARRLSNATGALGKNATAGILPALQQISEGSEPQEAAAMDAPPPEMMAKLSPPAIERPAVESKPVAESGDDLEPDLNAIRYVESRGNVNAVSPKGARGSYQLMPANIKTFGVKDPHDEKESRVAARKLLSEELKRFGGDRRIAYAAYNAGSPKVKRAIRAAQRFGWKTDFDHIRYFLPKETRSYVEQVLKAMQKSPGNGMG